MRKRMTNKARLLALCLLGVFLSVSVLHTASATAAPKKSRTQLKAQQQQIWGQIRQVRSQLRAVKAQENATRDKRAGDQTRVRAARGSVHVADLKYQRSQIDLRRATNALATAEQSFAVARQDASGRMVAVYERGEQGLLDILLSAKDFGDLLERAEVARFILERDRAAVAQMTARKAQLAEQRTLVAQRTVEAAALKEQMVLRHRRAESILAQTTERLDDVKDTRDEFETELAQLERDSSDVTELMQRLYAPGGGGGYAGPAGSLRGLPVAGRLGSRFGPRYHPILHYMRMHTGVDISAPSGTPIYAPAPGKVIFAGRRGGYGNCVIIDHGNKVSTLYGHMSSFSVSAGQTVSNRQRIGAVGSTGLSTGPHLHWEKRVNGSPVNPL
jgi:murein DD-endopeptidase MepM/ murein hydrolase activator NlpD